MRYFKTKELADVTGVGRDRILQWVFKDLLTPAVASPGRGRAARFDLNNLLEVKLIASLYDAGFPLKESAKLTKTLLNNHTGKKIRSICLQGNKGLPLPCKLALTIHMQMYKDELLEDLRRYDER